jgi:hypothetical protein
MSLTKTFQIKFKNKFYYFFSHCDNPSRFAKLRFFKNSSQLVVFRRINTFFICGATTVAVIIWTGGPSEITFCNNNSTFNNPYFFHS